jgi:hypothetical protein
MGGEEKRQRQTELDGRVKSIESCLSLRGFLKLIFASRLDKIISEFKKSQLIILCFNLAYLGASKRSVNGYKRRMGNREDLLTNGKQWPGHAARMNLQKKGCFAVASIRRARPRARERKARDKGRSWCRDVQ